MIDKGTVVTHRGRKGVVVEPSDITDGSYNPECNDIATYIRWEDGTIGWRYTCELEIV
jgi:hypothetical protein